MTAPARFEPLTSSSAPQGRLMSKLSDRHTGLIYPMGIAILPVTDYKWICSANSKL
jgi:hypothetical protein